MVLVSALLAEFSNDTVSDFNFCSSLYHMSILSEVISRVTPRYLGFRLFLSLVHKKKNIGFVIGHFVVEVK